MVNPNEVGIPLPSSLEFSPGPASADRPQRITEILIMHYDDINNRLVDINRRLLDVNDRMGLPQRAEGAASGSTEAASQKDGILQLILRIEATLDRLLLEAAAYLNCIEANLDRWEQL